MDRILSYKKVHDYLQDLAEKNIDITKFLGIAPQELGDAINSYDGLQGPALNYYGYNWKLSGNNQRTFSVRTISFAIIFAGIDPVDYERQKECIDQAEAIGFEVLSRIYQDSMRPDFGWLYNNMIKESIIGEEIRAANNDSLYGMDFHFDVKVAEPLVVDRDKWSDGDLFC